MLVGQQIPSATRGFALLILLSLVIFRSAKVHGDPIMEKPWSNESGSEYISILFVSMRHLDWPVTIRWWSTKLTAGTFWAAELYLVLSPTSHARLSLFH